MKKLKEWQAVSADDHQVKPALFRLRYETDRQELSRLLEKEKGLIIRDTILSQLKDLIATRNPDRKLTLAELEEQVANCLGDQDSDLYGVWIYYPWSHHLIHSLDEAEFVELRTNRNQYKITLEEQKRLSQKKIGIVGLSVGYSSALALALERGCGELRIADFDTLDLSNLNRVATGIRYLGVPKTVIAARTIAELDPFLDVKCFPEGIRADNLDRFLFEGGKLDLLVDLCDSLDIKVRLRYAGKAHRIPVLMETSDRGLVDIERFDLDPNYPIFHGMAGTPDPDRLQRLSPEEKIPFILQIAGMETLSPRIKASLLELGRTIKTWPQLGSAIFQGGGAVADTARRILLGQISASGRFFVDFEELVAPSNDASVASLPKRRSKHSEIVSPEAEMARWEAKLDACRHLFAPAGSERVELGPSLLSDLIRAAAAAPSRGNLQPWKWVSQDDCLYLFLDAERAGTFLDFQGESSLVALGASTENLVLAAHARHLEVEQSLIAWPNPQNVFARFHFSCESDANSESHDFDSLVQCLERRHTNRSLGANGPIPTSKLEEIGEAVQSVEGAKVQFLCDRPAIEELALLVGEGERLRYLSEIMHRELVSEIRWDEAEARAAADGLYLKTLELGALDEAMLRVCRRRKVIELLKSWRLGGGLERTAADAVRDASALGLVTMPSASAHDLFMGGRAVERLWLTATAHQMALQPVMTLPALLSRLERGKGAGFEEEEREALCRLKRRYRKHFNERPGSTEIFLFRLSTAAPVGVRSLRRPIEKVLVRLPAADHRLLKKAA